MRFIGVLIISAVLGIPFCLSAYKKKKAEWFMVQLGHFYRFTRLRLCTDLPEWERFLQEAVVQRNLNRLVFLSQTLALDKTEPEEAWREGLQKSGIEGFIPPEILLQLEEFPCFYTQTPSEQFLSRCEFWERKTDEALHNCRENNRKMCPLLVWSGILSALLLFFTLI